ncbi:polysaccharide deacetylase family protein [Aurantivibrio plasticivorans]
MIQPSLYRLAKAGRRALLHGLCAGALLIMGLSSSQAAVVLQYHHISDETPASTSTSPDLFAEHLAAIKRLNYQVVKLESLASLLREGKALPDKTVAITFDDGYSSVYDNAYPLLKQYGFPFTVFVNTAPIERGSSLFVSWAQLNEMANDGATIANHSHSHSHFLRKNNEETDAEWRTRIGDDIKITEALITKHTGQQHGLLAYPYGEYNLAVQEIVAALDVLAFGQQSGPLNSIDHLQALPRFPFGGRYGTVDDFVTKLKSVPMPLVSAAVTDDRGRPLNDVILPQGHTKPQVSITLSNQYLAQRVQCYASGQGAIPVTVTGAVVHTKATQDLPIARSRYNCTAPSEESGRYYWYSQLFIRKQTNGEWYPEE